MRSAVVHSTVHILYLAPYLYVWEGHANDKVTGPVAAACEGDGGRPRPLAEQFSHYEPRNRTGANLKEAYKQKDGCHADVTHPGVVILERKEQIFPIHLMLARIQFLNEF